jgi:hypothetical protein
MEKVFAQVALKEFSPSPNLNTFADIVNVVIRNAFMLAGLLAFIILVIGGFSVIMGAGAGDTKQMEKGKNAITGAVIGLLVVVVSVWIIQILEKITGQPILSTGL